MTHTHKHFRVLWGKGDKIPLTQFCALPVVPAAHLGWTGSPVPLGWHTHTCKIPRITGVFFGRALAVLPPVPRTKEQRELTCICLFIAPVDTTADAMPSKSQSVLHWQWIRFPFMFLSRWSPRVQLFLLRQLGETLKGKPHEPGGCKRSTCQSKTLPQQPTCALCTFMPNHLQPHLLKSASFTTGKCSNLRKHHSMPTIHLCMWAFHLSATFHVKHKSSSEGIGGIIWIQTCLNPFTLMSILVSYSVGTEYKM